MKKIVIAAQPGLFTATLADMLRADFDVFSCTSGSMLPVLLDAVQPDGVIIEYSLPEFNCPQVLRSAEYLPPAILVIATFLSADIIQALEDAGAGCVMRIPCSEAAVLSRISEMITDQT